MAERGPSVDHVTIWRWGQCYAPVLKSADSPVDRSGRVDETFVK